MWAPPRSGGHLSLHAPGWSTKDRDAAVHPRDAGAREPRHSRTPLLSSSRDATRRLGPARPVRARRGGRDDAGAAPPTLRSATAVGRGHRRPPEPPWSRPLCRRRGEVGRVPSGRAHVLPRRGAPEHRRSSFATAGHGPASLGGLPVRGGPSRPGHRDGAPRPALPAEERPRSAGARRVRERALPARASPGTVRAALRRGGTGSARRPPGPAR